MVLALLFYHVAHLFIGEIELFLSTGHNQPGTENRKRENTSVIQLYDVHHIRPRKSERNLYLNITLNMDLDLTKMNTVDPLKRHVEKSLDTEEHTPFDPPEAYAPATVKGINFEDMHPAIQHLMLEHREAMEVVTAFEAALAQYKEGHYKLTKEINETFSLFFKYFDTKLLLHNAKEDKSFFPLLNKRLIAAGEHSVGENPMTAIDIMEDDHQRFIQLGALCFNLFGLAMRLPDAASRIIVLDAGYENGRELVELLKLHIFREDYTLFPMAQKLMSPEELEASEKEMKKMK